jgi:hypothetical protein
MIRPICCLLIAAFAANSVALCDEPSAKEIAEAKNRFAKATDGSDAGKQIDRLLALCKNDLKPLLSDDNTSIALFAAWEAAKKHGADDGAGYQWFVGFLQGRTGLELSMRWEFIFAQEFFRSSPFDVEKKELRSYLKKTDEVKEFASGVGLKGYTKLTKQAGAWAPEGLTLARTDSGELSVSLKPDLRVTVPATVVKETIAHRPGDRVVRAEVADGRVFVAIHDHYGTPFPLLCFDSKSGKLLWQADSWSTGNPGQGTGVWYQEIELLPLKKSMVILGDGQGCYLEAFDAETGKPKYRFCNHAWYERRGKEYTHPKP